MGKTRDGTDRIRQGLETCRQNATQADRLLGRKSCRNCCVLSIATVRIAPPVARRVGRAASKRSAQIKRTGKKKIGHTTPGIPKFI